MPKNAQELLTSFHGGLHDQNYKFSDTVYDLLLSFLNILSHVFLLESSTRSSLPLKEKISDGFEPVEVYSGQCFIKIYDRESANLSFARHVIYDRFLGGIHTSKEVTEEKKHRKYMS
jgi:hypothetical protein